MAINYELLKTFVVAGNTGNFRRAAKERFVSVSAVSQQIKTLETQLGTPLFDRLGRRVQLTPSGRALLLELRGLFERIDAGLELASADHAALRGSVSIGAPRSFSQHWLRPRLASLLGAHDELSVKLVYGVPSVLEPKLSDGELDLAILVVPPALDSIERRVIAHETFFCVAAPSYLAKRKKPRVLSEFLEERYVVFDRDLAMHRPWWRSAFGGRASLPPRIVAEVPSCEAMLALALDGVALAVLPDYLVDPHVERRELVRLEPARRASEKAATFPVFLGWRRNTLESARLQVVREALLGARG
jgi:DNA-binding transcriptional LysR family regulator